MPIRPRSDDALAVRAIAHNLQLEAELLRILDAFDEAQVDVIVLKGIPLRRMILGSVGTRPLFDNDLLVREVDLTRAYSILVGLGYASPPHRGLEVDRLITFEHAMSRSTEGSQPLVVELHWEAFPPELFRVPESMLWAHSQQVALSGRRVRLLTPELTILHLASHFVQHACLAERILLDLAAACNSWSSSIDRAALTRLALETRTLDTLAFALTLAVQRGVMNADPFHLERSLRSRALSLVVPRPEITSRSRALIHWARLMTWTCLAPSRVPAMVVSAMFPPLPVMGAIYGEPPSWRLARFYLPRLIGPLKKRSSPTDDQTTPGTSSARRGERP